MSESGRMSEGAEEQLDRLYSAERSLDAACIEVRIAINNAASLCELEHLDDALDIMKNCRVDLGVAIRELKEEIEE